MNKDTTVKWFHGWKNIITIILFFIYPPLAILVMWILASWSKKVKFVITSVVALIFLVTYFSANGGANLFPNDPRIALDFARRIADYGFKFMGIAILTAVVLSIVRRSLKITLKQIWVVASVVLFITFLLIMFSLLSNVQTVYTLTDR